MAFLNRNDDDIWGGKTSEGKFNSNNGGGYGRHGSTSGTYGRHNTSSRGQGDDLLAEADDVLSFNNNNNSSRSRGNSAREQYEERERERAKRRTARSLGGPGVNRSGKPTIGGSGSGMSPMRNNKSKDFSRPRQNLRFSAVGKNTNVDFGMDDNFLDPFDSDDGDVMEEELPSKSSLKRGIRGRREVVAESIDETDKNRFVEDDYDNEDRWKNGSEKVNRSAKKKAARDRQDLFNDEEDDVVEDFNNNDDDYRGKGRRAAPRDEGKTSDRKEKKPIRMVHSSDDEDEGTMIRRKKQSNTPLKKKKNRRFKESNQKGFMDEVDTEDIGGKTPDRNSKKTKKKKKRGPKPPPDMDDSADEDDMFKIDVPEDRRKMTREERLQAARLRADKRSPKRKSKASNKSRTPTKDQKPKPPSSDDIDKEADAAPRARGIQRTPNLSNMKEYVMAPARRRDGVVQCYIERIKPTGMASFGFGSTQYHLYLKENDTFLMAAKPRKANKTSNYLISISKDDLARKSDNYVGKLRSNFLGTEFNVYDDGMNPNSGDKTSGSNKIREELGIAMYASNLLGSRGPRKMRVAVPVVDERTQRRVKFQPRTDEEGILRKFKDRELDQLFYMINKPPRWNDQVGAYVLNFNGRVTMASVKNFQLINPEDQERVVLQFGRVAKDKFTMDFQSPLSPFQAFAISLSSFDSKLACE